MQALQLYAGPRALQHLRERGLTPRDVRVVAGAAGGPKGLILSHLDRQVFGSFLANTTHGVHLVGASIGAWRMATGALPEPGRHFERLAREYIHERYVPEPGRKTPSAEQVSRRFAEQLDDFFSGHVASLIAHPRFRLHIVTSRGRHVLGREGRWRTPLGYLGAVISNAASRKALSAWLERVVFSSPGEALPVNLSDLRHRTVPLNEANFQPALLASCSIPFVLKAVHDIPGGPPGAYWDGGITDYHLHWNYSSILGAAQAQAEEEGGGLVLYPHFQQSLVPGWLDKAWRSRHRATPYLDNVIVLAPKGPWVQRLPHGKLPDRNDFARYGRDHDGRVRDWTRALGESERLADEWNEWLARGTPVDEVLAL